MPPKKPSAAAEAEKEKRESEEAEKAAAKERAEHAKAAIDTTPSGDLLEPIKIDVEPVKPEVRREYLLGMLGSSPMHGVSVGGQNFPKVTEEVAIEQDGTTSRSKRGGRVVALSDKRRDALIQRVKETVMRREGRLVYKMWTKSPRYRPMAGDEPIAKYIYMIPIGAQMPVGWRDTPKTEKEAMA